MNDIEQISTDISDVLESDVVTDKHILVQFKNESGEVLGSPFDMPADLSKERLQRLCDALLQKVLSNFCSF